MCNEFQSYCFCPDSSSESTPTEDTDAANDGPAAKRPKVSDDDADADSAPSASESGPAQPEESSTEDKPVDPKPQDESTEQAESGKGNLILISFVYWIRMTQFRLMFSEPESAEGESAQNTAEESTKS